MADSAAALTYMIQGLDKPIVLTGAQKSIFGPGSDAPNNLFYAVKAATMDLGEVVIAFGDRIVRGSRAIKVNEQGHNAFDSPRIQPVAEIGLDIFLADHRIRRGNGDPRLFTGFDTGVETYHQSSGTDTRLFEGYINNKEVHGIVIGGYGAGSVQDKLISHIAKATKKSKPVLVVTNCLLGAADMNVYEVGVRPLEAGAISARDMTMEAAVQKLMFALGRAAHEGYHGADKLNFVKTLIHRPYGVDISPLERRF